MTERKILQRVEVTGVAASCEEPITASMLSTRKGNKILITLTEFEQISVAGSEEVNP